VPGPFRDQLAAGGGRPLFEMCGQPICIDQNEIS
jgi:hypothetical protein